MRTLNHYLLLTILILFTLTGQAQLSPPGLGTTKTAFWSAIGVSQKLDAKNSSMTYIGLGRISDPEGDSNPIKKQSILVLNQEFYHKFARKWQYSYALSYRRQDKYESEAPYELKSPAIQQEFRLYGRLTYTTKFGTVKWKNTVRQEARKFFTPDFEEVHNGIQLRTRFKTQANVPLDNDSGNSLIGSAEALFAVNDDSHTGWDTFGYKESRFCLYYQHAMHSAPITFDIGYMNDLMGGHGQHLKDANYLAVDIIFENIF